jgi:tetratricopeptide (TPR) repeat protein
MKALGGLAALFSIFISSSAFGQATHPPVSRAEILGRLALSESPSAIARSVRTRGIGFTISEDFLSAVKRAGGEGILADNLFAAQPAESTQANAYSERPYSHFARCAELLHIGDAEEADIECKEAIDENPQSPWPLLVTANVLTNMGAPLQEQVELFRRAIAAAPDLAEAHRALAFLLTDPVESKAELTKALELESSNAPDDGLAEGQYADGAALGGYVVAQADPSADENQTDAIPRRAVESALDLATTHENLAYFFATRGNPEKAVNEFGEALRLEPGSVEIHESAALFYQSLQKEEDELAELREAVRIAPYGYRERSALASALESRGLADDAVVEWRSLLDLSPRNVEASEALVQLYFKRRERKAAIAELRRSLKASAAAAVDEESFVDKRLFDIDELAQLLTGNKEYAAAAEQYVLLLRFKPDWATLHNNLGNVFYAQRRIDEAVREYREALRLQPDLSDAHHNLANCLLMRHDADGALKEYQETLELEPGQFNSRVMIGISLMEKGEIASAIGQFKTLLEEQPGDPKLQFLLGHAYYVNKDLASAVPELRQSLRIRPNDAYTENDLARIYATSTDPQFRNPTEALALAERAAQSSEEREPQILDTLAEALLMNGHAEEALKTEEQAAKLAPDDPEIQSRLKHFLEAARNASPAKHN